MQKMKIGLIQMALNTSTDQEPGVIRDAMNEAHLPMIQQAAEQGVQVLCFQEVFNQPYFCPSQDSKWYAAAERVPEGPTCQMMQKLAAEHRMVIIVPIYEETETGVYYNTAAVFDADGSYLGKYHKTHIPQVAGFWEKFFFKPGQSNWPVFDTAYGKIGVYICYDRHFPEGWRALALTGQRAGAQNFAQRLARRRLFALGQVGGQRGLVAALADSHQAFHLPVVGQLEHLAGRFGFDAGHGVRGQAHGVRLQRQIAPGAAGVKAVLARGRLVRQHHRLRRHVRRCGRRPRRVDAARPDGHAAGRVSSCRLPARRRAGPDRVPADQLQCPRLHRRPAARAGGPRRSS